MKAGFLGNKTFYMKQSSCLLFAALLVIKNISAQNKDLDAQYLYTQAEYSYSKNEFEACVSFCEKAASALGETNPKIMLLQFNAYEALIQKCPHNNLLTRDFKKIDYMLTIFFQKIDARTYPKEKYFQAMKLKDDLKNYDKILYDFDSKIKLYTLDDLGLVVTKQKFNGVWKYLKIVGGPLKEQTSLEGFWVEGTEDAGNGKRMGTNGVEAMLERINLDQSIAKFDCLEFFATNIFASYPKVADISRQIKITLKIRREGN